MNKNNKIEDSLNKIFSTSGYKMVDVSSKEITHRKALNRLKIVVEKYDKTVFVEEALHRLVEVYYRLGLVEEAKQAASILGYNYQSGEWYKRSYKVFNKKYKPKKIKKNKKMGLIRRKIKNLFE